MSIGILRVVEGDVTDPQFILKDEVAIIPHVCNNGVNGDGIGVMGAGVAKALRDKWPSVYNVYKRMEDRDREGLKHRLGENCYAKIDNHLVVVNMIGQDGIGVIGNSIPLKYKALISCMARVVEYIEMIKCQTNNPVVIHSCKFGSDLAGGTWEFVLELIREIWLEAGINVVIYEFVE